MNKRISSLGIQTFTPYSKSDLNQIAPDSFKHSKKLKLNTQIYEYNSHNEYKVDDYSEHYDRKKKPLLNLIEYLGYITDKYKVYPYSSNIVTQLYLKTKELIKNQNQQRFKDYILKGYTIQ